MQRQQIQKRLNDLTEKKNQNVIIPTTPAFEEALVEPNSSGINALNRVKSGQQEPNSASGMVDMSKMALTNGVTENTAVNSTSSY